MPDTALAEPQEAPVVAPSVPEVAPSVTPPAPDSWEALPEDVRRSAEPYVKPLKEKLTAYEKEIESSKGAHEKAVALDRLVQDRDFQEYWQKRQNPQRDAPAKTQTLPYTSEEYQAAYDRSLSGDHAGMAELQKRVVDSVLSEKVTPALGQLQNKAREIELSFELNGLLERHPDAKDLDKYGFLEPALHYYTDKQGKPMEFAYARAKEAYDRAIGDFKAKEAKEIQDKKAGVTERPGVVTEQQGVQYLDSPEAVLKAQVLGNMKGERIQYRLRPRK